MRNVIKWLQKKVNGKMKSKVFAIIFLHHGIGDVLMAFPLLKVILAHTPINEKVVFFVKSSLEKDLLCLLINSDSVEVKLFNRKNPLFEMLVLRNRSPKYLLASHATTDWRMPLIARCAGASLRIGPESAWKFLGYNRTVPTSQKIHKVEYFLQFAEVAGFSTPSSPDAGVHFPPEVVIETLLSYPMIQQGEWIIFAPGSGVVEKHKRWPAHHYSKLGTLVLKKNENLRILLLGSPSEIELLQEIQQGIIAREGQLHISTPQNIFHSLVLLSKSRCLVSGCSGSIHMGAAVGVPIVGLYGPTNPGFTGPYSRKIRIVCSDMRCAPCYRKDFIRGCENPICTSSLLPERIIEDIQEALDGHYHPALPWRSTTSATEPIL